jgi:hypothetical protein
MTETTPHSTEFVIPLVDNIEDESYSKYMLMEMFITHMLDYGYEKPEIQAMLEHALAHPQIWLSTKELMKEKK